MKKIFKKSLWFTVITTLCLVIVVLFAASGCDKTEIQPKHYTITFAGEGVGIEPQSVIHGNYATVPENPKREGFGFIGWFTDNGTFANKWDFKTDIVTQDTTLYAKWEENTLQEAKWKLTGILNTQTGILTKLEPQNCEECYTLTIGEDYIVTVRCISSTLTFDLLNLEPIVILDEMLRTELYEEDGIYYEDFDTFYRAIVATASYTATDSELKLHTLIGQDLVFNLINTIKR